MVFNSYTFALFCPVVLAVYWRLRFRAQNVFLVLASYVFYAAWDPRFLVLMWFTTGVDFLVGRALDGTDDERRRKRILTLSIAVNLGVLALFKYFNFFVDSGAAVLRQLGLEANPPVLQVLLPIGISFYTFHGISYTVDVYRRHVPAVKDLVVFAAFVAYFPQLVAGPIGRAEVQLPQFQRPRPRPTRDQVWTALTTIALGFVKKIAIADALAPWVNETFAGAADKGALTLLMGAYAFALQIYGDFSGYTDIARGVSQLFGISLLENFRQPYLSRSVTEFWQRWHISLSTWLRDYLYIPLGGNRGGRVATARNLMLTMLIGGLWHGAAWTFVAWGALHGAYLVLERLLGVPSRRAGRQPPSRRLLWTLGTFHAVVVGWVFFRAADLQGAIDYLVGIASLRPGGIEWSLLITLAISGSIALTLDLLSAAGRADDAVRRVAPAPRGLLLGAMLVVVLVISGGAREQFIYFQF